LWYVQDAPDAYKGAQVMRNGLDDQFHFLTGAPPPRIEYRTGVDSLALSDKQQDAFAIRFAYDDATSRFYPSYIAGMSTDITPPGSSETSSLWDFQACLPEVISVLRTQGAMFDCQPNNGLTLTPQSNDPQLSFPFTQSLRWGSDSYFRVGISARYRAYQAGTPGNFSRIFWSVEGEEPPWTEERSAPIQMSSDGNPHTYWLVIPNEGKGQMITGLRYDPPLDINPPEELMWIQVDIR
jgi:hypothetical protein